MSGGIGVQAVAGLSGARNQLEGAHIAADENTAQPARPSGGLGEQ